MTQAKIMQELQKLNAAVLKLNARLVGGPAVAAAYEPNSPASKVRFIRQAIARHFELTELGICSPTRPEHIAWPRQIAMYLCRELTPATFQFVASQFGARGHGTAYLACQHVRDRMSVEPQTAALVNGLRARLEKELQTQPANRH